MKQNKGDYYFENVCEQQKTDNRWNSGNSYYYFSSQSFVFPFST